MKAPLYTLAGEKKSEIELPPLFDSKIREDIVAKYYQIEKFSEMQPYANYAEAGKRHSASGTISHRRHEWKGHYGKGIARVPRKAVWRRGVQFYWIGAEVSGTRGGRRAHPPRANRRKSKINEKEARIALYSGIAATANPILIVKRYSSINSIKNFPAVIESLPQKTKDLISALKKIYSLPKELILKQKRIRSGKGKLRGRRYKSNLGLLIIKSKDEKIKPLKGFDIKNVSDLKISDLYPLGRLALYTQRAIEELK